MWGWLWAVDPPCDVVQKDVSGAQAGGDAQPLLPALVFLSFPLAQLTRPSKALKDDRVFLILVVEVQLECIPHTARDPAPGSLPLVGAGALPCAPHAGLGARKIVAPAAEAAILARDVIDGLDNFRAKGVLALHAEPGAPRDAIQVDAVCMVCGIAAVAEQQHLLVFGGVAHGAGPAGVLWLFDRVLHPFSRIVLGHDGCLLLVLDPAGGQVLACNQSASVDGVHQNRGPVVRVARRTSNLIVHGDGMERLAADGAAVCLVGPFPQTGVVQHVAANLNLGYMLVVLMGFVDSVVFSDVGTGFVGCFGECIRILNRESFVVLFQQLLWCCRGAGSSWRGREGRGDSGGRGGLDVQGLQTDDALISHG